MSYDHYAVYTYQYIHQLMFVLMSYIFSQLLRFYKHGPTAWEPVLLIVVDQVAMCMRFKNETK